MIRMLLILFFIPRFGSGQPKSSGFSSIDWKVRNLRAPSVDSLSRLVTAPYDAELEKTRAIFSWIAQNISYNTGIYHSGRRYRPVNYVADPFDTVSTRSAIEQTAEKVLRRRVAVCDGYAKLFKAMCDYAGIESEVILGYGKGYVERNEKFRTNHTWNAVRIDSVWHLLDITWAAGFITFSDEFVQRLDDSYFLTPPNQFVLDHYPDELKWTLLEKPPTLREFHFTPFKYKSFLKYGIRSVSPANGTITARAGDTIRIELNLKDASKDRQIAPDAFFDSTVRTLSPASVFLDPVIDNNRALYSYVVPPGEVEWIHLVYNRDPVLRYRLNIKITDPSD